MRIFKIIGAIFLCSSGVFGEKINTDEIWRTSFEEANKSGTDDRLIAYKRYIDIEKNLGRLEYLRYNNNNGTFAQVTGGNYCQYFFDLTIDLGIARGRKDLVAADRIRSEMCGTAQGCCDKKKTFELTKVQKPSDGQAQASYGLLLQKMEKIRSRSRQGQEKIAIVAYTDLHCNDQNYSFIAEEVKKLTPHFDKVIVIDNGDSTRKVVRTRDKVSGQYNNRHYESKGPTGQPWKGVNHYEQYISPSASDTAEGRIDALIKFYQAMLKDEKVHVVYNIGNHELIRPNAAALFFKRFKDLSRTHIISNLATCKRNGDLLHVGEPPNGFDGLVDGSVQIGDVKIVGYCTEEVISSLNKNYREALQSPPFIDINNGHGRGVQQKHKNRLKSALHNSPTPPILVLACHAGFGELSFLDNDKDFLKYQTRVIIGGHTHVPDGSTHHTHILGNQIEIHPLALGYSVSVIKFHPYSAVPDQTSGEAEWSHLSPKSKHSHSIYINDERLVSEKEANYKKMIVFHSYDW